MSFLQNIGKAVGNAVSYVGERNRRAAYLNRIRAVIRCEERAAEREYLALGRYYYNNLRDRDNPVTEAHCAELDDIDARMDKALGQLERFYEAERGAAEEEGPDGRRVFGSDDGPVAIYVKKGAEEVTLDDVEEYDSDPELGRPGDGDVALDVEITVERTADEPEGNDDLPFEG